MGMRWKRGIASILIIIITVISTLSTAAETLILAEDEEAVEFSEEEDTIIFAESEGSNPSLIENEEEQLVETDELDGLLIEEAEEYEVINENSIDLFAYEAIVEKHEEVETITLYASSSNQDSVWNFLKEKGLSDAGAAGVMGNFQVESGFWPNNLENAANNKSGLSDTQFTSQVDSGAISRAEFISSSTIGVYSNGSYGYGLAQWTYPARKASLYDFAKIRGVSIGDLQMQLDFFWSELGAYSSLVSLLKTTTNVEEACFQFHNMFEGSANTVEQIRNTRVKYAIDTYNKYSSSPPIISDYTTAINPEGCVDIVEGGNGTVYVSGWALDRNSLGTPLNIHVYVGGTYNNAVWGTDAVKADKYRPDVENVNPGVGEYHGFDELISVPVSGTYEVYVYAINVGGSVGTNYNTCLGSVTVTIKSESEAPVDSTYTINYHLNGGINNSSNPSAYTSDISSLILEDPSKDYYNFVGWYTAETGGEKFTSSTVCSGDLELYARWEPQDYTLYAQWTLEQPEQPDQVKVTFDVCGGDPLESPVITVTYGSAYGELVPAQRDKYAFGGWYTAPNGIQEGGKKVEADTIVTNKEDHTLYAEWKQVWCRVDFDYNGGTHISGNISKIVKGGTAYGELPIGEKEGYDFSGWFTEKDGGTLVTAETIMRVDYGHTLYAHWSDAEHVHEYKEEITGSPSCVEMGTKQFTCEGCGSFYEEEIPATGHTWDMGIMTQEASCKEVGIKTYTCSSCSEIRTEELPKTSHSGETYILNAKDATTEEEGYTGDICCKVCDIVLSAGAVIPKITLNENSVTFTVNGGRVTAGKEIIVTVDLSKNTGIAGFSYDVNYDEKVMRLISVSAGDVIAGDG